MENCRAKGKTAKEVKILKMTLAWASCVPLFSVKKAAVLSSMSTKGRNAATPMTFSHICAYAVKAACLPEPMLAMYPVMQVPIFDPSMMMIAEETDNSPFIKKLMAIPMVAELE